MSLKDTLYISEYFCELLDRFYWLFRLKYKSSVKFDTLLLFNSHVQWLNGNAWEYYSTLDTGMNILHHLVCAQDNYYPVAFVFQWSKMVLHFKVSCKACMLERSLYLLLFHRTAISPVFITVPFQDWLAVSSISWVHGSMELLFWSNVLNCCTIKKRNSCPACMGTLRNCRGHAKYMMRVWTSCSKV